METVVPVVVPIVVKVVLLLVMIFGVLGILTTLIPGIPIIYAAIVVYAIAYGLSSSSGIIFSIITLLFLMGIVIDNVLMGSSARQTGAGWLSVGLSLLALVIGSFIWPPFGGLIAGLAVIFIVELIRVRDVRHAWSSTRSLAAGCGWSVVVRFVIGLIMIALWAGWAFLLHN